MNTVSIIIQARMGSSRYPGKMLAPLAGKPVIDHVIDRALDVGTCDDVYVATSHEPSDDPLVDHVRARYRDRVEVCRGMASNVLARFYQAAIVANRPDYIVRLTGDCPLVDPRQIEQVLDAAQADAVAYTGVTNSPDGTDVEVFTFAALQAAYYFASLDEVEHVTTWIRANRDVNSVESLPALADIHYSVNTVEDLRLCEQLIEACGEGARYQDHVDAIRRLHVRL